MDTSTRGHAAPVAVVGLGAMGSRMARRLVDAGHDVVVWNRTASRAAPLVEAGARAAATPAAAAAEAGAVLTMVADPGALAAVTEGHDGVLAGLRRGGAVLEASTVGPAAVTRLRAAAPAGVDVLDTPVLGSVTEAEAGTLQVFVGGEPAAVGRWSPLLAVFGTVHHVGPPGAGAAAKLVANTTLLGVLGVLGEAVALGRRLGVADDALFEVLATTPLAAQAERRRPVLTGAGAPRRFALSLAVKDADLVAGAASAVGLDARVAAAVRSWFAAAEAAGMGGDDYAAVLRFVAGTGGGGGGGGPAA